MVQEAETSIYEVNIKYNVSSYIVYTTFVVDTKSGAKLVFLITIICKPVSSNQFESGWLGSSYLEKPNIEINLLSWF